MERFPGLGQACERCGRPWFDASHEQRPYGIVCQSFIHNIEPEGAPASIQTAMLSLSINRGWDNHHLKPLGPMIERGEWKAIGERIGDMQQLHRLPSIARRRREEGEMILAELEALQA